MLSLDQSPKIDTSVVGCLIYVMVCSRPYLAQAASQVYKFISKPGKRH